MAATCACAHHTDGSVTTFLCSLHADYDPCWTMARVTGRRRKGSIRSGTCSACGWSESLSIACNRASKVAKLTNQPVAVYEGCLDGRRIWLCIQEDQVCPEDADHIVAWRYPR